VVTQHYTLENESETRLFAQKTAQVIQELFSLNSGLVVYLQGDLGAGKSFFSRAFIQYFLPQQKVKSPTYTIVESYQASLMTIHHFDLYRLSDPEELEYLAIRDLLTEPFIALVEWPQKGEGVLPSANILIELKHVNGAEENNFDARLITLSAGSRGGAEILKAIQNLQVSDK